jgi:hypothetical protein
MTESKRSNAAGEKYALRGIYGSEPYWPQEKLKICVTGAGGFIGTRDFFFFFVPFSRGEAASSWRDRAGLARSFSLSVLSRVETRRERERERSSFSFESASSFRAFSFSLFLVHRKSPPVVVVVVSEIFFFRDAIENQRLTALLIIARIF